MVRAYAILIICLACHPVLGQQRFQLVGRVTDTAGVGLARATVKFMAGPDTVSVLTGEDGRYAVSRIKGGKFSLVVTMKGYLPLSRSFTFPTGRSSFELPVLTLRTDYLDLEPVTVSRAKPITITEDTVSYHAAAFPVRDGSEVEDILKRLPGVEVDLDGNVIVQGKKLEKVLVNGKEFFGGDVLLAIWNLPADVVDKLQVIDDYGDKARLTGIKSGEPAKLLNIVLKADKRNGRFGQGQAAGGNSGKYTGEVFGNSFTGERQFSVSAKAADNNLAGPDPAGSGALSWADRLGPRWSSGLNASVGGDNPQSRNSLVQQTYYPGQRLDLQQTTFTNGRNRNEGGGGVLTFKPDAHSTLRITPNFGGTQVVQRSTVDAATSEQDSGYSKITQSQSVNAVTTNTWNAGTDLYFERILPASRRRFSIQANVHYTNSQQSSDNQTTTQIISNAQGAKSLLHYLTSNNTPNLSINLQSNFFLPVSSSGFLELGYTTQSFYSLAGRVTQSLDSLTGVLAPVDSLSLNNYYRAFSQQLHGGYTGRWRQLNWGISLDGQPGMFSGKVNNKGDSYTYRYFTSLPQLQAAWKIKPAQTISLSYRGQSSLPTLQQVSPVKDLTNPQYPVTGNPGLKPSYTQSAGLHYERANLQPTRFSGIGGGINYSLTSNPIVTSIVHPRDSSQVIQATSYTNTGQAAALSADYHLTFPAFLHKWVRIVLKGNLVDGRNTTVTDNREYSNLSLSYTQSFHLQLLIPDHTEMDVQGNYTYTHITYSSPSQIPATVQSASLTVNAKQYFLTHWSAGGNFSQLFTSAGGGLQPAPASLTANLQRQFLAHNKATIGLTGYNLLNSGASAVQSVSPTSITKSETTYSGRYVLLTLTIKIERFK